MAYIGRYDWDLATGASDVTASAEDAEYPATNLITEDAANPAKLTSTTGSFVLQFPSPIVPAFAMLAYQYLDAALAGVKIQANSSDSWGSPAFEQTFTIPSKRRDGPSYQRWTKNPMIQLTGLDPGGYEWWRLVFGTANSQAIAIGRLLLFSQLLEVDLFHVDGSPFDHRDATTQIANMTALDVESGIYMLGGPRRTLGAYLIGSDLSAGTSPVQTASDFQDLHEVTQGREHPFAFLPFGDFNDVWLVRPEAVDMPRAHRQGGYQVFPLGVREIARGLPWP
jgi:hypothetical protein